MSASTHLMSWLTEPASGLSSAGSGPTGTPVRPASAAATSSQTGQGLTQHSAAHGTAARAGGLTTASSGSGEGSQDVGPQRDQGPPPLGGISSSTSSAGPPKPLSLPGALPASASKVLSGPAGPSAGQAGGASTAAAAGGQVSLATAGSAGSISSGGSSGGSQAGGFPHSCSGESLEDLESMRMSSAYFAAALAEAEAIAAGVAASMAAHQQGVQAHMAAVAAARESSSSTQLPTDR